MKRVWRSFDGRSWLLMGALVVVIATLPDDSVRSALTSVAVFAAMVLAYCVGTYEGERRGCHIVGQDRHLSDGPIA